MNQKKAKSGFAASKILFIAIVLLATATYIHAAVTTSKPLAGPKSAAGPIKPGSPPDTAQPASEPPAWA